MNVTHFIAILTLLQWSGTKPEYLCILLEINKQNKNIFSFETEVLRYGDFKIHCIFLFHFALLSSYVSIVLRLAFLKLYHGCCNSSHLMKNVKLQRKKRLSFLSASFKI